jgi:enoyl-CoA hydratase/carnithine racemase
MSEPSTIHVQRLANVDYVTLNRPEVRNAFNEVLIAELTAWAERSAQP